MDASLPFESLLKNVNRSLIYKKKKSFMNTFSAYQVRTKRQDAMMKPDSGCHESSCHTYPTIYLRECWEHSRDF